ncbi:MAG TPA: UDP-N-acetylmuramoyl-tripeptide--D-alanyl-D-alanine ligase, partial [Chromatiaceae bacterium]|nr:UDP-N-acetylmuramoyl-tripeptide--D-alanyl-D-alanine ligase [Chromatiaceae bacterium]
LSHGDRGALGPDAPRLHRGLGEAARAAGVAALSAVGDLSREAVAGFGPGGYHLGDREALIAALHRDLTSKDVALVKGSRRAAMDQVVAGLGGPQNTPGGH